MKFIYDLETNGLNSIENRITCISLLNIEHDTPISFYGESEPNILKQFWNAIKDSEELIGWNSNAFDWIFLIHRSLIHKIKLPENWDKIILTDIKKIVNQFFICYNNKIHGTLSEWSVHLGLGRKENSGEEMVEAYKKKDWKTIKKHCENDVIITKALWQRCNDIGLIK